MLERKKIMALNYARCALGLLVPHTAHSAKPLSEKTLSAFSLKTFLFRWFRIEPALLEFHHESVFLTSLLEDPHRLFKIVRIHHLNFNHCVITAFIVNIN
jgi:hypothetical protein